MDIDNTVDLVVHERHFDEMKALQALQERLAEKLVEPEFDLTPDCLATLERFDPEAAAEVRRHPAVYQEQRRILRAFAAADSRTIAA